MPKKDSGMTLNTYAHEHDVEDRLVLHSLYAFRPVDDLGRQKEGRNGRKDRGMGRQWGRVVRGYEWQ